MHGNSSLSGGLYFEPRLYQLTEVVAVTPKAHPYHHWGGEAYTAVKDKQYDWNLLDEDQVSTPQWQSYIPESHLMPGRTEIGMIDAASDAVHTNVHHQSHPGGKWHVNRDQLLLQAQQLFTSH